MKTYKQFRMIFFLALANIFTVTSITVQAASLQEELEKEAAPVANMVCRTYTGDIIVEKALEAERITRVKQIERYNQELLASIIFCEAGNQTYEGQVAVGAVVMNRIKSAKFPNTLEEVIYQPGQFVPAMTGWLDEVRATCGYTESAFKAAKDSMQGMNPIGECLFFDQGGYGYQIGAHYFH